jgi:hypothetical protein
MRGLRSKGAQAESRTKAIARTHGPGYGSLERRDSATYRYFLGSASRPSMALAATVAGLPRKMRASREPIRPW